MTNEEQACPHTFQPCTTSCVLDEESVACPADPLLIAAAKADVEREGRNAVVAAERILADDHQEDIEL